MESKINLKEIERKAYKSTFQDGLLDILLGCLLLTVIVVALLPKIGVPEGWNLMILSVPQILLMLVFLAIKKHITVPRLGIVKFSPKRKRKIIKSVIIVMFLGTVGMVIFFVACLLFFRRHPASIELMLNVPIIFAVMAIIAFSLMAYFQDCTRLYVYGALLALTVPLDMIAKELTGKSYLLAFLAIPATVMLVIGTVLLIIFLQKYPLPEKEKTNFN